MTTYISQQTLVEATYNYGATTVGIIPLGKQPLLSTDWVAALTSKLLEITSIILQTENYGRTTLPTNQTGKWQKLTPILNTPVIQVTTCRYLLAIRYISMQMMVPLEENCGHTIPRMKHIGELPI